MDRDALGGSDIVPALVSTQPGQLPPLVTQNVHCGGAPRTRLSGIGSGGVHWNSPSERRERKRLDAIRKLEAADVNSDGVLDQEEIVAAAPLFGLTPEQAKSWFETIDEEKSGSINPKDFLAMYMSHSTPNQSFKILQTATSAASKLNAAGMKGVEGAVDMLGISGGGLWDATSRRERKRQDALRKLAQADSNSDGVLDLEEVVAAAAQFELTAEEAESWFVELDTEQTGSISPNSFLERYMSQNPDQPSLAASGLTMMMKAPTRVLSMSENVAEGLVGYEKWEDRQLRRLSAAIEKFQAIDTDGNGELDLLEVIAGAPLLELSPQEAESWFRELDADGTGKITMDTFLEKFKQVNEFEKFFRMSRRKLSQLGDFVINSVTLKNGHTSRVRATFKAADELGRGALARGFKKVEINALALRLLRGHTVYSQSWRSDLWLHLKNKQIFLSLFFVHPDHPFSRNERISAVFVSCLLAWGLEFWFCVYWTSCDEHPDLNFVELFIHVLLLKIAISAITNGIYDAVLEQAMTCACVQEGCPVAVKDLCELLSLVALLVQAAGGVCLIFLGVLALTNRLETFGVPGREVGFHDTQFYGFLGVTIRELVIGKFVGLFVVTLLIETLGFFMKRGGHMKPSPENAEARAKWDRESTSCCGVKGNPPNHLWNRFIGETLEMNDLPEHAPTYDVDVYFFGKVVYSERADDPANIPRWFRNKEVRQILLPVTEGIEDDDDDDDGEMRDPRRRSAQNIPNRQSTPYFGAIKVVPFEGATDSEEAGGVLQSKPPPIFVDGGFDI